MNIEKLKRLYLLQNKSTMKTILLLIILSSFLPGIIYGQSDNNKLTLVVKNIRNDKGSIGIQLLNEQEELVDRKYVAVENKNVSVKFTDIPKGKYAIRAIHDENENDDMDYNWLGLPKEGFGFSGDKKRYFGYPDIKDILIQIDHDTEITVEMIYIL